MSVPGAHAGPSGESSPRDRELEILRALERKVLWLATWTIHHANHLREKKSPLKVGGHQSSCASIVTLMTALYFDVLRPQDRVAVKPHASPVFHAIQYLLGRQDRKALEDFRGLGGAQSYPSRTKDRDDVDFSTGSVGLGVAVTLFASLAQDYVRLKKLVPTDDEPGRMVAMVGDAELDEGNVFESLLEGWKHDIRNVWWVIDYNRQSLDRVVEDRLFQRIDAVFESMGWDVKVLKYGRRLEEALQRRGGDALRKWLDDCPNSLYSALVYKGGSAFREHVLHDLGDTSGIRELLDEYDDAGLHRIMTNLGGHDLEAVLDAFHSVDDDRPTCFLAYTIKGFGLPFAGHKDNHPGLTTPQQIEALRHEHGLSEGEEWEPFAGLGIPEAELRDFLANRPFARRTTHPAPVPAVPTPERIDPPPSRGRPTSTQEGFGRMLAELARQDDGFVDRLVTSSPDVTISTNLGGWVNRRGVFDRRHQADVFRTEEVVSAQKWEISPEGQHVELGIAENNLFLLLSALGLSGPLFGTRLLPIGVLYDCFIARGLDALNYACYQGARFLVVATPSGISLAPEGGAHQSIYTPLIGMGQPGLASYEPAFVDELAEILRFGLQYMQAEDGGSIYLRLSTRPIEQPDRELDDDLRREIVDGGYWAVPPAPGSEIALVYTGVVAPEVQEAHAMLADDVPGLGVLAVTAPERLHDGWRRGQACRARGDRRARSHVERLLARLAPGATLVTVHDAHPAALSWLGSVAGNRVVALGVDRFGQSGDLPDLYDEYDLSSDAIVDAVARACLDRRVP